MQIRAFLRRRAAPALTLALLTLGMVLAFGLPERTLLTLTDRRSGVRLAAWPVAPGDTLSLEIEHSFEHIPWFEFYSVTEELHFNLDAIAVAGYGAGVPAEMDVPTRIEGGLVWMEQINSRFPTLHWITSDTYMKGFALNGTEIFDFRSLPDASRVEAKIITTRGYLSRG